MRSLTLLSIALSGLAISSKIGAQNHIQPNIILIMTDQQRADCVGIMGNPYIKTPNTDALARDGALFMNGYSSLPSSTPARASLLTGNSPWKHGMLGYFKVAPKYPNEMPQMMKEAGYFTFGIGKMHWTPQRNLHGFHGTFLDESGRVESEDFVSDYRQWFAMEAPGLNPDSTGIGWNAHQGKEYVLEERLHPTQWTGNEAIRFIENYNQPQPLFLKISFARPHSPYDPPKKYVEMYKNKEVAAPSIGDWSKSFADRPQKDDAAFGDYGIEHALESRRYYYGAITFVDDQIGRIIESLKDKGIYDNSLIIFISDHGDMLGDHHHWRKTYAYEGSSHIPFIVKPPKNMNLKNNQKIDNVVELRDVLPTFLDVAHVDKPQEMDGMSVLPLLNNPKSNWRKYIDLEHATFYENHNYWAALTDGKTKYIWFFHTGEEQLFDLLQDRGETINLSNNKKYSKELLDWRNLMINHLSERGEPYVKNGALNVFEQTILTSPNYPRKTD